MKKFLEDIQTSQPQLWESIQKASKDGLIIIDESTDSITATNRLLWTYPDLHEALNVVINQWSERELKTHKGELSWNL